MDENIKQLYSQHDSVGKPHFETNLFRYAGNNPINYTDPLGLFQYAPGAGQPVDERTERALRCFEGCLGIEVTVTGARQTGPPHVKGSAHESGQACDLGKTNNAFLTREAFEGCFAPCSGLWHRYFEWGYESPKNYHLQTRPGRDGAIGIPAGIRTY
jgi:hypothetical protein